jgi:hypothetical protein
MCQSRVTTETELDRVRAERDVALTQIARTKAIMARKETRYGTLLSNC